MPGHHGALVQARVDLPLKGDTLYFRPSSELLPLSGIDMEESLLCPEDGCMFIPVGNNTDSVTKIDQNTVLGLVYPCTEDGGEIIVNDLIDSPSMEGGAVLRVHGDVTNCQELSPSERHSALLARLNQGVLATSPSPETEMIVECALDYNDVFALGDDDRGEVIDVEHRIETADHPPIHQAPYRVPFALRDKITELVQQMLDTSVIQESSSPWASPVVMVKKDNSLRFCVDYR